MFDPITDEAIATSLRAGDYNLLLGAGISTDSINGEGQCLPGGDDFRRSLCELKGARSSSTLQRVFSTLTASEVNDHVSTPFSGCSPGPSLTPIPTFLWRRVFTFNIDDALEAAYEKAKTLQDYKPFHFTKDYEEWRDKQVLPVVHLHGWSRLPNLGYVFSNAEYARNIRALNPWMMVLSQFLPSEPFIIIGSSLDEVDLEYYLSHRTAASPRADRGPSIFVEPFPDAVTRNDCEKYGLQLYEGTAKDFFAELDRIAPNRPSAAHLAPASAKGLFPDGAPPSVVMGFCADFELINTDAQPIDDPARFLHGHSISWEELAGDYDVGRLLTRSLIADVGRALQEDTLDRNLTVIIDETGTGKTTILRRAGFELARLGYSVVNCSVLGRVDAVRTAEAIDLIDEKLVVLVDNLAEHVGAISDVIERTDKKDVIFIGAERGYRRRHLTKVLGNLQSRVVPGQPVTTAELTQLIDLYSRHGLVGSRDALRGPQKFVGQLIHEPIAVACCRILNDFRPLDRILDSLWDAAGSSDRQRYTLAAIAQYCFPGGLRYEVLSSITGQAGWDKQFLPEHPLPLEYYLGTDRSYIVPLNATIAGRILERVSKKNPKGLFDLFVALGKAIAPYVNRGAIRRRAPEARLAGRLFDYDEMVRPLFKARATEFYKAIQPEWQWNSRYWEQVALMELSNFFESPNSVKGRQALLLAAQHSRHAVSVELHPLPLTTLGKILLVQMGQPGVSTEDAFLEAYARLTEAIEIEQRMARINLHPFITLFRGVADYTSRGGRLDGAQAQRLREFVQVAKRRYPRDAELNAAIDDIAAVMR